MSGDSLRVMVVEDNAFARATVTGALEGGADDIHVVCDTASAVEALDRGRRLAPHAALLDLDLGEGPSGVDLARALRRELPGIGIVILTSYDDPRLSGHAFDRVPEGTVYLLKREIGHVDQVRAALRDSVRAAAEVRPGAEVPMEPDSAVALTDEQIAVMRLVAEGASNAEIARQRHVSATSVERMIARIARELRLENDATQNRRVLIARAWLRMTSGTGGGDD